jgi:hypothetical protein
MDPAHPALLATVSMLLHACTLRYGLDGEEAIVVFKSSARLIESITGKNLSPDQVVVLADRILREEIAMMQATPARTV